MRNEQDAVRQLLLAALEKVDKLDLTLVAVHIATALDLLPAAAPAVRRSGKRADIRPDSQPSL